MAIVQQKTPLEISNIFNRYFTSVGHNLATQVPNSSHRFNEYLSPNNNFGSFFFDPVSPDDIEREILSIPKSKFYGLYSCPIRIYPVLSIFYLVLSQTYLICLCRMVSFHPNWKRQKLFLSIKAMMRRNQVIINQYHYSPFLISYL